MLHGGVHSNHMPGGPANAVTIVREFLERGYVVVDLIVAEELKGSAVKLGRTGEGDQHDGGTAAAASLGVVEARLNRTTAERALNILRGPIQRNIDLSVNHSFAVTERVNLEWRHEFFNLLNIANFANPGGSITVALKLVF